MAKSPKTKRGRIPRHTIPVTFDVTEEQYAQIEKIRGQGNITTRSSALRHIFNTFAWENHSFERVPMKHVAVRLSEDERSRLEKIARARRVSLGEVIRASIESYATHGPTKPHPHEETVVEEIDTPPSEPVAKKSKAKKKVSKKASKGGESRSRGKIEKPEKSKKAKNAKKDVKNKKSKRA